MFHCILHSLFLSPSQLHPISWFFKQVLNSQLCAQNISVPVASQRFQNRGNQPYLKKTSRSVRKNLKLRPFDYEHLAFTYCLLLFNPLISVDFVAEIYI